MYVSLVFFHYHPVSKQSEAKVTIESAERVYYGDISA